jgi:heat shock protein HslJ
MMLPAWIRSWSIRTLLRPLICAAILSLSSTAAHAQGIETLDQDQPPSLEGEVWQLDEYLTANGLRSVLTGTGSRYAVFDNGRFRINGGCNTLNGSYWLEGDRLIFSPHVASLLLDCPDTLMAQEQTLLSLFAAVERIATLTDRLNLVDASGKTLLKLTRPESVPLQGRIWQLKAYRDANGAIVSALPTPVFSLEFIDAGNLEGRACDAYRAIFTRDEQNLSLIGPVAISRQGCRGSEAASRQGIDYVSALEQVRTYQVDTEKLLLRDADGRMLARFEPADDDSATDLRTNSNDNKLPFAPKPLLPILR